MGPPVRGALNIPGVSRGEGQKNLPTWTVRSGGERKRPVIKLAASWSRKNKITTQNHEE